MASNSTAATREKKKRRRTTLEFWLFVGPLVLGLLLFVYIPILWGLVLSFFRARNTVTPSDFVGFDNYTELFGDARFVDSLQMVIIFAIVIVPITFGLSLGLALLVNSAGWNSGLFRTIFFIPTACSYVVASLVWKTSLFNGLPSGFMNNILWMINEINPIGWITTTDPPLYWLVLTSVRLWLQSGFYMIIFLAGLQEIPKMLYEACNIDGASSGWKSFRYITFPLLRNTSISVMLLLFIEAFQAFDEFRNILATGGASGMQILARPPLVYLYNIAFQDQNYGRGAAGAFTVTAIIMAVTIIQGRLFGFGKRDYE
jgi:multiple sugar transport system permease protein